MSKITKEQLVLLKEAEPNNYIVITIGWSIKMVLPFKAGVSFLTTLQTAEKLDDGKIISMSSKDTLDFSILSKEEYIAAKMNHLLNIEEDEGKE